MARFYGEIGYAGETVETKPGVWEDVVIVHKHSGDVLRNTRRLESTGEKVNNDITVGNSISIVANAYARENFMQMRYVKWMGKLWVISDVEVQHPRLILQLGGLYNGPTAPIA